ncbi:adenylyl-sulfate kinase [Prosthecochloris sp. GSB1]|uniref:adenylyl-sulfate kinase n=1 Tax=Prosthecochloris sp. GSB1 TaxID=281093 RepID=UPI000B8CF20F|nr:adenylyl-sulfate kinase [Prosthecochloris sp. GSB1]ASQ91572.1 adenylyl-sulfate kinase [Prosthecochloris sp. GSB1]
MKNIHPVFDQIVGRAEKEKILGQRGVVLWFTGLSGAGKTTVAAQVERSLASRGILTQLLDGDNIRTGINSNLGFIEDDRRENIRRLAEVSRLFVQCGVVTLACAISPTLEMRAMARQIISPEDFIEIFIDSPLDVCESRDVKGLYRKARAGEMKHFTGIDAPFEAPLEPDIHLRTHEFSVGDCVRTVLAALERWGGRKAFETVNKHENRRP